MFGKEILTALAPMEEVTDSVFRKICKKQGADMVETEFVSAEALVRNITKSKNKLIFEEQERPIGIQIFGNNPDIMTEAAKIVEEYHPDFIDLNFGCPVRKIVEKGGGAALLKDVPKMLEITEKVVKNTCLPVFVKTRLGWDEKNVIIDELAEKLQDVGISALTIHGRTKVQMYKGCADWTLIGRVKNNTRIKIPVIGNGDIDSAQKAMEMKNCYGVDGIMIGRASIGNPWIFNELKHFFETGNLLKKPDIKERVKICRHHLIESIRIKNEQRAMLEMRKHYSGYFKSCPDFKKFRTKLVSIQSLSEILNVFQEIENFYTKYD